MSEHMKREIDRLKKNLLSLGAVVEENVRNAVTSVENRDPDLAQQAIDADHRIDQLEVDLEEECLKILALHQPVAIDLRFLVSILKINNDLERIGDLAVSIAKRGVYLACQKDLVTKLSFREMETQVQTMLRESLESVVSMDAQRARQVIQADDEVDAINGTMYDEIKDRLRNSDDDIKSLIYLFSISRNLERIADHATNIAEDVIYLVEGEIVRHKGDEF